MRICIDAGHGGKDPGAIGSKSKEKNINLAVATIVRNRLQAKGHDVIVTRLDDKYVALGERCNIPNKTGAELFISIHSNSASNKDAKGVETLCYKLGGESEKLAAMINNRVAFGRVNRGVKPREDLSVLSGTRMTACLVELGFISNLAEETYMLSNIEHIAYCIVKGIDDYINVQNPPKQNEVSEWAVHSWERCKNLGIIDGTRPKDTVTREEMAVIIDRTLKKAGVM